MSVENEIAGQVAEVENTPAVSDNSEVKSEVSENDAEDVEGDDTLSDEGNAELDPTELVKKLLEENQKLRKGNAKKMRYSNNQRSRIRSLEA